MQIQKVNSSQNFGSFVKTSSGLFNPEHISVVLSGKEGEISLLLLGREFSKSFKSRLGVEEIAIRIARAIEEKDPKKIIDLGG